VEWDIEFYKKYLTKVKLMRKKFPQQVKNGWIKWEDLKSLDDHDAAVAALAAAIESGDEDEMFIEKVFLDQTLIRLSREITEGKLRYSMKHMLSKGKLFN